MTKNAFIDTFGRITSIETRQGKKGPFLRMTFEDTLREEHVVACFVPGQFEAMKELLNKDMVHMRAAPLNAWGPAHLYRVITAEGWSDEEILGIEDAIEDVLVGTD